MSHTVSGGLRLYLRRQADNLGRYVLEQALQALVLRVQVLFQYPYQ